jgi:hypothetical protein
MEVSMKSFNHGKNLTKNGICGIGFNENQEAD